MQVEVNKNLLAGALVALWKLISRTSPVEAYKFIHTAKNSSTVELPGTFLLAGNRDSSRLLRQLTKFEADFVKLR